MALEFTWPGPTSADGVWIDDDATTNLSAMTLTHATPGTTGWHLDTGSVSVTGAGDVTIYVPLPHIPTTINGRKARIQSVSYTVAKALGATTTNFVTEIGVTQAVGTSDSALVTYTPVFQQTTNALTGAASASPTTIAVSNEGVALDAFNARGVRLTNDGLLYAYLKNTVPASDTWTLDWYVGSHMQFVMDYAND